MSTLLFNPADRVIMETEYFQVRNEIFDLTFKIRSFKRYKENGKFIKNKYVVEYRDLDTYEIATYIYLCRCANNKENAFPSYNRISEKIRCSKSKAQESIENLFSNGFIYKENRFNDKGEYISNSYIINTKLDELNAKLNSVYANKKNEILTEEDISILKGIPSDNTPIPSDNIPSIPSDNTPIPSDGNKKEQQKKNNSSYKKQSNNNHKNHVVVNDEEIVNTKEFIDKHLISISKKDTKAIIKELKSVSNGVLDLNYLLSKMDAVKNYAKSHTVKNLVGALITAIKEGWETNKSYSGSTFNDFEQRDYNFDELENKLLGWNKEV